jgi:two-component system, chemotaxis family, chemotaxis protein CheY
MPSVLIVDDDDDLRGLLRATLEQAGYKVTEGCSGQDALQRYQTTPADLVVMDILMPDKDGLEGIMELRREFPGARIIAITGVSTKMNVHDFLDVAKVLGARRTLHKPFSMPDLLTAVEAELAD